MVDSIGLGQAIANVIYLVLLVVAVGGSLVALTFGRKFFAFLWISILFNILVFLVSLGMLGDTGVFLRIIAIIAWPFLNIFLIYKFLTLKKK